MSIEKNIRGVLDRVALVCERCKRDPQSVRLVAVSKTVAIDQIAAAVAAGVTMIGENRVQEAWQKYQSANFEASWHMIGHLQTNKVKRALQFVAMIQSVDSIKLARALNAEAEKLGREIPILVQVNCSGEESKFGLAPEDTLPAIRDMSTLPRVQIQGLMTIGAHSLDTAKIRHSFRRLRNLRDTIIASNLDGVEMKELSMGMTGDFEIAVEEGATLIRIGRSIFGDRIN